MSSNTILKEKKVKQNIGINKEQQEFLGNFMKNHEELARGILKTADGRQKTKTLWKEISSKLNEMGPPVKELYEWKKTWSDLKYKVKGKLLFNKKSKSKTGGGPFTEKVITDIDELIIDSAGLECAVSGIENVKTFGCASQNSINEPCDIGIAAESNETENDVPNEKDNNVENYSDRNTIKPKKTRNELMDTYVGSIEEINKTLKKLADEMKSNRRLLQKQLDLQDKIFTLKKQMNENKEHLELKRLSLEIKKEDNELKRIELQQNSV